MLKISPSPMRLPLVALLAKQNTRFVVMERIQTLDYLLCMVRDCKKDLLTGILPPGTPTSALALRAGDDLQNNEARFDEARKATKRCWLGWTRRSCRPRCRASCSEQAATPRICSRQGSRRRSGLR